MLPYDRTGYILYMNTQLRKKIISEYLSGKGSTTIEKELSISKPIILKILKEEGITRKRDRCKSLDIKKEGNQYALYWKCKKCEESIKRISYSSTLLCRNHYRQTKDSGICKKCSLELQVGEGNPFYGKKHSKKSKNKISKGRKGKGVGNKNAMSNELWREKQRKKIIEKWESGELEHLRLHMSNILKERRRLGKIKSVITSKKEKEIILFLKSMGVESIQSFRVDTKICDIYIPSLNLIIEYFGDYWHCNPKKYNENYYNKKKSQTAKEIWDYDRRKLELIANYGYNLEVVWESDLKNNNKLIQTIIGKYDTKHNPAPERSSKD